MGSYLDLSIADYRAWLSSRVDPFSTALFLESDRREIPVEPEDEDYEASLRVQYVTTAQVAVARLELVSGAK
jgi:hypothetical protein